MANRFVQAPNHGGSFRPGQPSLIIVHSLEAPPRRGIAYDLAAGWLQSAPVSPQHLTDPSETVDTLHPGVVGWHCGNGNQKGVGLEVTGYAGWSAAQWLEPEAFAAVRLDAKQGAIVAKHYGIPMRWLSLSQILNGERGFCTHNDISLTLKGTTHWDPGPNFPFAIFMQMVQQWAGGWDGIRNDFKPITPPAGDKGGAQPKDWFDMATKEELQAIVDERLAFYLPRLLNVLINGQENSAFNNNEGSKTSTVALDGMGLSGRLQRLPQALRLGQENRAYQKENTKGLDGKGLDGKLDEILGK